MSGKRDATSGPQTRSTDRPSSWRRSVTSDDDRLPHPLPLVRALARSSFKTMASYALRMSKVRFTDNQWAVIQPLAGPAPAVRRADQRLAATEVLAGGRHVAAPLAHNPQLPRCPGPPRPDLRLPRRLVRPGQEGRGWGRASPQRQGDQVGARSGWPRPPARPPSGQRAGGGSDLGRAGPRHRAGAPPTGGGRSSGRADSSRLADTTAARSGSCAVGAASGCASPRSAVP
jgi:hypothetical protein